MRGVRRALKDQVLDAVGQRRGPAPARTDAGLFGPRSVAWRVHGDFTAMMVGGVAALLVQMLHPKALAGVWDHSDIGADMSARLRRTAQFISGTTYGSTEQALGLIERVRSVHEPVEGVTPDGEPYRANDPELLTFVHVAETHSFLRAHIRYRDPFLSRADQDRYFAETALVARKLGAGDVPSTRAAVDAYLEAVRPQLKADGRTIEIARRLLAQPAPSRALAPAYAFIMQAGVELLPDWAAMMHGLETPTARRPAIRAGVVGVGAVLRWAMRDGQPRRA